MPSLPKTLSHVESLMDVKKIFFHKFIGVRKGVAIILSHSFNHLLPNKWHYFISFISTLLFFARPSSVALLSIGSVEP